MSAEAGEAFDFLCECDLEVVAGDGFVEAEGHHFIFRPCFGSVEVDEILAGAGAVGGGLLVVGGGGVGCDVGGDGGDAVGDAGMGVEDFDEFGVDAFAHGAVGGEEALGVFVIELRIGAEVFEEGGEVAFEADFFDDGLHLGADAFDFLQADVVDFDREVVGGGVVLGAAGVFGDAVGELACADFFVAGREVFVFHEGEHALVTGDDFFFDGLLGAGAELLGLGGGDGWVEFDEGGVEEALGRVFFDLVADLCREALHDDAGVDHFALDAFAHEGEGLVHVGVEGLEAGDPVGVVFEGLEAHDAGDGIGGLDTPAVVEGDEVPFVLIFDDLLVELPGVEFEVELVARGELGVVEGLELFEGLNAVGLLCGEGIEGEVWPKVVVAFITEARSEGGA